MRRVQFRKNGIVEDVVVAQADNATNATSATQWNGRAYFQQATAPTATGAGDKWYDTSTNREKYWNGTAWIDPLKYQ